jgi:hypothetical protein
VSDGRALSRPGIGGCETFREQGMGFTLACTGVFDEDNTGGLMGAKLDVGGIIGANEELEGGGSRIFAVAVP